MAGSSIGHLFRVTTAGESHGPANVAIVDGCPAGVLLTSDDIQTELDRRRPGQSLLVSQRSEADAVEILSGVYDGKTTGTPIALLVRNHDARSRDYSDIENVYRPGHADFTYDAKFGFRDPAGGGRASARETVARVAAGAVAQKLLAQFGMDICAYVVAIGDVEAAAISESVTRAQVDFFSDGATNAMRCPDEERSRRMALAVTDAKSARDSLGGVIEVVARNVPPGLGEPVFDKLKADIAKALFSIPAVVGVETGEGFRAATMKGSDHNDVFVFADGRVQTSTNRHGGTLGGISSGMPLRFRAAFKPTSSIAQEQESVCPDGRSTTVQVKGRHDPCVVPRAVPIVEAMVAMTLADHLLRQRAARL